LLAYAKIHKGVELPRRFREQGCVKDFSCGYNSIGVMRKIDVESGVHLFIRVIRGRVLYDRDLVAELDGIANRGFDEGELGVQ
jgi:hypothetical protein